jgi:hypothetical protein
VLPAAAGTARADDGGAAQAYLPNVKHGHVAPGVSLDVVKTQLASVRGSLVQMPLVRCRPFSTASGMADCARAELSCRPEGLCGQPDVERARPAPTDIHVTSGRAYAEFRRIWDRGCGLNEHVDITDGNHDQLSMHLIA